MPFLFAFLVCSASAPHFSSHGTWIVLENHYHLIHKVLVNLYKAAFQVQGGCGPGLINQQSQFSLAPWLIQNEDHDPNWSNEIQSWDFQWSWNWAAAKRVRRTIKPMIRDLHDHRRKKNRERESRGASLENILESWNLNMLKQFYPRIFQLCESIKIFYQDNLG